MNATLGTAAAQLVPLAVKDLDQDKVTPGLLGFVIFALIGLSLWWLMKNMNRQFKKIDFEEQSSEPVKAAAGSESPGRTG
ncbi:hypothetical protein PV703_12650 [Streptomyces sp. ME01-24h]|nr:hypothetical protein [Streptomyces sp. ME19-03-3]MDX3354138.1 hypothetical protein [Streptomyces sp. ME01-24h]